MGYPWRRGPGPIARNKVIFFLTKTHEHDWCIGFQSLGDTKKFGCVMKQLIVAKGMGELPLN